MSFALLIIDVINDFQFGHGPLLAKKTEEFVPKLLQLKSKMKMKNLPVIYVNDHYGIWQADYEQVMKKCSNEKSINIIEKLSPKDTDYFLIKPKHSGFYETSLHTLLAEKNIDTLLLSGIAGNICVLFTANDAYMRGYNLFAIEDCIASNSDQDNQFALTMMKNVLKATLVSAEEMLKTIENS